jgi:hypothetical protein
MLKDDVDKIPTEQPLWKIRPRVHDPLPSVVQIPHRA